MLQWHRHLQPVERLLGHLETLGWFGGGGPDKAKVTAKLL